MDRTSSRKVWIWVAAGVAGVLLIGILALKLYLTPERLRAMLVPRLEASLNRPVKLARVGLSLWGGIEASVEGLEVADRPGFGGEPFVAANRAALSLRFWPLLKGEAELGEVALERPRVSLVVDEKGEANYADMVKEEPSERRRRAGLPVERLVISNGRLRYEDRRTGSVTSVEGIDYRLRIGLSGGGIGLSGDLEVANVAVTPGDGKPVRTGALRIAHDLGWSPQEDRVAVEALRVSVGPLSLQAKGEVRQASGVPALSLAVENPDLALDRLAAYLVESGAMSKGASIGGRAALSARIEGAWNPEGEPPVYPEVSGRATLKEVSVRDPGLGAPVEGASAELALEKGTLRLASLKAVAGRSDLSATGRVEGLLEGASGRVFVALEVVSKALDLDELIPAGGSKAALPSGWGLVAPAYGAAPAGPADETDPTVWLARVADGEGKLRFDDLVSEGVRYRNFRADAKAKDRVLRLENVRAQVYGGAMRAEMEVDARPPGGPLPVKASVRVDSVQANGLLQEFLKWRLPLHGRMELSLTLVGAADSTLELVEKEIQAEGAAQMNEGKLVNWKLLKEAGAEVEQLGFMNFDELPIRALQAPFRVADGRIFLNEMRLTAAGIACRLNGSTGMDGSLDYTLDVDLPASRLNVGGVNVGSALGSFFGGGAGATIPLRVRIGGTTDRVQVRADLQPQGKEQIKKKEEEVKDKLKEKGKKLLEGLF